MHQQQLAAALRTQPPPYFPDQLTSMFQAVSFSLAAIDQILTTEFHVRHERNAHDASNPTHPDL